MADPLSIAASIAGVISLADIVFIRTRKYISSARNADKDVKDLSQEVLLLSGALHSLSRLAQALDADGLKDHHIENLRMYHIAACHATLDDISKKLKRIEDSGAKRKLVWPFVSDRTKELLAEVSRHKENVNLALTADSMGTLLEVLSMTEEVQGNMETLLGDMKKTREIVTRIHQDSDRKQIINYFLPYNPQQNYEMSLSLRHPRTGLWLTRKPEFQTWLQCPDSALWLSGIPGAGKTVLAGTIVEEALKRSSEDVATIFFFCDYKDVRTQATENVLSALASQLAIQKEETYACLDRYYRELHPSRALDRRPDVPGLQNTLVDMVKFFDHVHLIVDGLDECGDNTDDVIDGILDIVECSDNISTALLSRDEYNIRDRLEEDFTEVEIAAHTEDITEYVTSEIEKRVSNRSLRIDDLGLKGEILERLIGGARGMFRWVACQLDFLGDCVSDKECREALNQLPPGLDESYRRILQRIPKGKERTVQLILNFIAYADPQLDIPRLREAISMPEKVGKHDAFDARAIIREGSITMLCRSLIRKSNDGRRFEFAHFSVKEFLEGGMQSVPELEKFRISKSLCRVLLAKQCLKYLLLHDFSSIHTAADKLRAHIETRNEQHPFYFYAAVRWPVLANTQWVDEGLVELARVLFQPQKTGNFITWVLELATFAQYHKYQVSALMDTKRNTAADQNYVQRALILLPRFVDKRFTTLHMAATLSLPMICSSLICNGSSVNQLSGFGSPLQCVVQGLTLTATDQDGPEYRATSLYSSYYHMAHEYVPAFGKDDTMRLLLRSGAEHVSACANPYAGQTLITVAMKVACTMENLSAIAVLLEAGYSLGENELNSFTSLGQRFRHSPTVSSNFGLRSLIRCLNSMVDKSAAHFSLCQAAWSLAIEKGCDFARDPSVVDTRISHSPNALANTIFTSVRLSDTDTLAEALKDPRADLLSLSRDNKRIFDICLDQLYGEDISDELSVIRMLLCSGMEVKQPNHEGLLPIHELASKLTEDDRDYDVNSYQALCDIVSEFIRRGTSCHVRTRGNQNVFHIGLESRGFIKAVLQTETEEVILAALGTRDEQGYTPIALALHAGEEEVALLLLQKTNCDPESLSSPTSVYANCVTGGANRVFNILLDAGVELESAGTSDKTLLHFVGPKTGEEFVLQLIRMFPDGVHCRRDAMIPLDVYFESCICSKHAPLNTNVVRLLAASGSDELDKREKEMAWENLIQCTQNVRQLKCDDSNWVDGTREHVTTEAITSLLKLGFVASYEADAHVDWILQLLKPLRCDFDDFDDLWPVSSDAILRVLEHTALWGPLRGSAAILRLLKAAVKSCLAQLVGLLLENGVSVHQRIDEMSALEVACLQHTVRPDAKHMFTLLLDHADSSRLNEINSYQGQERGLVHYLIGPGKQWQLEQLLKRNINVNLRTNVNVEAQPAIVQHLLQDSPETATILLESGADPTLADTCGMDAALAAAFRGNMAMLLCLHMTEGKDWQLHWQRTFSGIIKDANVQLKVSKVNALHLAAWSGLSEALQFYIDRDLLTNINTASAELYTPMHVAAFNGQINAIRFLYSRGGDINLRSADGSLPLHLAVRNKHSESVKFLVENGSAIDADTNGLTPVGYAMRLQNQSILDCLRTTTQYLDYRSQPRRLKQELLYAYEQALTRNDVEECERLLSQGCPVNADLPGQKGRSALIMAIENSEQELIKWLLNNGAKATRQTVNASTTVISPLSVMVARPALSNLLPLLLQKYQTEGGSITHEEPSLICGAVLRDNNIGLKLLLDHVARHETLEHATDETDHPKRNESPVNQHRFNGDAPLHAAARRGNCEAVKLLLDHGAGLDVLNNGQMTPLQVALIWEPLREAPAARLLLRHGAALEQRTHFGDTAVILASRRGDTGLIRLLDDAGADLKATNFASWGCLRLAAENARLEAFVWLVHRGLQIHAKDSLGWSATQCASFRREFSSFLLNFGSAIEESDAIEYANRVLLMHAGPAWLNEHFNLYLRRLGLERLRAWANLEPTNSWSPLCMLASMGQVLGVTNVLRLGADVDFEGSPCGSALMAACSSGSLESVKLLVWHGAAISYLGSKGMRSAFDAARNQKAILAWLLVNRFTEHIKISDRAEANSSSHAAGIVKPWSGIVKAELVITGTAERQVHESSRDYWIRLMAVKRGWRGRIVRQHEAVQTHRPSRLNPEESVRICPGYYGVPEEQK